MMGEKEYEPKLFHSLSLAGMVPQDHLLRRLEELIDLSFVRKWCRPYYSHTGQPSVDPVVIFKMMLLGYLYGITSERKLAEECGMHLGFRWYLGYDLDEKTPDHSVLSKARRRYGKKVFEKFFRRVLKQCLKADLVGGEVVHADSTLVRANAARRSLVSRESFEPPHSSRQYVEEIFDEEEAQEEDAGGKGGPGGGLNQRQVSKTDPDAALVKRRNKGSHLTYKQHFTVDDKQRVITAVTVTSGEVDDSAQVKALLDQQPVEPEQFCADQGYGTAAVYGELKERKIRPVIPRRGVKGKKSKANRIPKSEFQYQAEQDVYICPQGKRLRRTTYDRRWDRYYYRPRHQDCRGCELRDACTSPGSLRIITRPRLQEAVDWGLAHYQSEAGQRVYRRRQVTAEWVVSEAKGCHGLRRAQFRGLEKVSIQVLMIASVQNLKRLLSHRYAGGLRPIFDIFAACNGVLRGLWRDLGFYYRNQVAKNRFAIRFSDCALIDA